MRVSTFAVASLVLSVIAVVFAATSQETRPPEVVPSTSAGPVDEKHVEVDDHDHATESTSVVTDRIEYRKVVDGREVYRSDLPPDEALVGPPPIVWSGVTNPSHAVVEAAAYRWLDELAWIPVDVDDLATIREQLAAARWGSLRFVDDRMLVGLAFSGDQPPADDPRVVSLHDRYCELAHVLNRTEKTYSPDAMQTAMGVVPVVTIEAEIRTLKADLVEDGYWPSMATLPVSLETIYQLGGNR